MKKTIIIILLILLISLVSVSAKEYTIKVWEDVVFEDRTIKLQNVGSNKAIIITVDNPGCQAGGGDNFCNYAAIPLSSAQTINGVEITNKDAYHDDNDLSLRWATIDIHKPNVVCYQDNFCDQKIIDLYTDYSRFHPERNVYSYRGHVIRIERDDTSYSISIEIDGIEEKLYSPWGGSPSKTITLINGLGVRYNYQSHLVYFGENFGNCLSDCPLNEASDANLIKALCQNGEKDEETKEKDIDCEGFCSATCGYIGMPCKEDKECKSDYICYQDKCFECPKANVSYCETGLFVPLGKNETTSCNIGYTCCGDGVCDGKEDAQICPPDCYVPPVEEEVEENEPIIILEEGEKVRDNYSAVEIEETPEYEGENTKEDSIKGEPNNIFYRIFNFFRELFG